jgi:biopolymer transport protein ExbB
MSNILEGLSAALVLAAGEGVGGLLDGLKDFFQAGGPFMYINVVSSAVAIAIIVERTFALVFKYSLNGPPFMDQIEKLVRTGNVERAIKLCGAAPTAALSRVVRAGLTRANRGETEVAKAIEEAILEVTPWIQKRIASLWSLANIATLLGLIGTITGLIRAFRSLGAVDPARKAEILSKGISEAMNNTAFGLGIAVTCIVGHLLLTQRSKNMIEEIELDALKLENLLGRHSRGDMPPSDGQAAAG